MLLRRGVGTLCDLPHTYTMEIDGWIWIINLIDLISDALHTIKDYLFAYAPNVVGAMVLLLTFVACVFLAMVVIYIIVNMGPLSWLMAAACFAFQVETPVMVCLMVALFLIECGARSNASPSSSSTGTITVTKETITVTKPHTEERNVIGKAEEDDDENEVETPAVTIDVSSGNGVPEVDVQSEGGD